MERDPIASRSEQRSTCLCRGEKKLTILVADPHGAALASAGRRHRELPEKRAGIDHHDR
jgi:hypothetical protein